MADAEVITRRCARCKCVFPVDRFYWNKAQNTPYSHCKSCHADITNAGRRVRAKIEAALPKPPKPEKTKRISKLCRGCEKTLPLSAFYLTGLWPSSKCKQCLAEDGKVKRREATEDRLRTVELMPPATSKRCATCRVTKSLLEFYWNKATDSYMSGCKECVLAWHKDRDATKRAARRGPFLPGHLKSCVRCETVKPKSEFYISLSGQPSAYCQPCHKVYSRETKTPEAGRKAAHNRRARKAKAGGTYRCEDIADILRMQKMRCAYCAKKLTKARYEIDHITSLARGGSNDRRNLQATCPPCNRRKHASDPLVFARYLGRLL